jgi:hypothetical protein
MVVREGREVEAGNETRDWRKQLIQDVMPCTWR